MLRDRGPIRIDSTGGLSRIVENDLRLLASTEDIIHEPVSLELLGDVARADEKNMREYLRTRGYFDARVFSNIPESSGKQREVIYRIDPGPVYQLEEITWEYPADFTDRPVALEPVTGEASARTIHAAVRDTGNYWKERGYPSPVVTRKEIVVDHATRKVHATYLVQPGARARLGRVEVSGLDKLRHSFIRKATPWTTNELYRASRIDEFERRLGASGLFSSIQLERVEPDTSAVSASGGDETYDLKLKLSERRARTIQFGVGYRTDTGAETSTEWQHRNALGGGEHLMLGGKITGIGYEAESRITVPFFRRGDQSWSTSLKFSGEDTDAYDSSSIEAETWVVREINRRLTGRAGLALQLLDNKTAEGSEYFFLGSVPMRLSWDYANNLLDATKGHRILLETAPYQGLKETDLFFWKSLATLNGFVPFDENQRVVLATRLTGGVINGGALADVPPEERFYAGGGQSVRGYAYQSLSPRDDDGIVGGLSLLESSFELRGRITSSLGAVIFMDGGFAFPDRTPDLDERDYFWGAGLGFRYFTAVGPIRIDAGFPLDRREGIDDAWQFYISIGQAF